MPPKLTAEQAQVLLAENGHNATNLSPVTGGLWSTTFAFTEAGRGYIVRFHERRDDLEKDRFAMRWSSARLRIPRIVEIIDTPAGPCGISERAEGTPIDDLDVSAMRALLPALFATLDAIREARVAGTRG